MHPLIDAKCGFTPGGHPATCPAMGTPLLFAWLCGPAIIAVAAAIGAVVLFGRLDQARTVAGRVMLWIAVSLLSLTTFGIGTCYAMVFTGGFR
jgi:hypothetical protein